MSPWLIVATAFALDRLSKVWLVGLLTAPEAPRVIAATPFLDLVLVWNRGVSYGWLRADSPWAHGALSGVIAVIVALAAWVMVRQGRGLSGLALALVVGGGASNLVDRLVWGAVADFFSLHWGSWRWYVFNLADVWIVAGVVLFILAGLAEKGRRGGGGGGGEGGREGVAEGSPKATTTT